MANNRTLGFDIVVNTQGSEKTVTTLKQDINALQRAIEQASKTGLTINIDGYAKNINEARELQNSLISQLEQLNSKRIDIAKPPCLYKLSSRIRKLSSCSRFCLRRTIRNKPNFRNTIRITTTSCTTGARYP